MKLLSGVNFTDSKLEFLDVKNCKFICTYINKLCILPSTLHAPALCHLTCMRHENMMWELLRAAFAQIFPLTKVKLACCKVSSVWKKLFQPSHSVGGSSCQSNTGNINCVECMFFFKKNSDSCTQPTINLCMDYGNQYVSLFTKKLTNFVTTEWAFTLVQSSFVFYYKDD